MLTDDEASKLSVTKERLCSKAVEGIDLEELDQEGGDLLLGQEVELVEVGDAKGAEDLGLTSVVPGAAQLGEEPRLP